MSIQAKGVDRLNLQGNPVKQTKNPEMSRNLASTWWSACAQARASVERGKRLTGSRASSSTVKPEASSRDMVRWFLSALSPTHPAESKPLAKDLEGLNKAVRAIISAADEDVITEEEADAVIKYLAECFTRRRFDQVIAQLTIPKHGAWFVVQGSRESEEAE